MKNLLIIFTLFLGLGAVNAQTKTTASKPAATKPAPSKEQPVASVKAEDTAQAKGPTKEQTIEYINNKMSQLSYRVNDDVGGTKTYTNTIYKSSVLENCILKVSFSWERDIYYGKSTSGYVKKTEWVEIPIDKIEKITTEYGLRFYAYQKAKIITNNIKGASNVFGNKEENIDSKEILAELSLNMFQSDAEELLKAFNHLRKLCGSPEPISFD